MANGILNPMLLLQVAAGYTGYRPKVVCTQTDNESIEVQVYVSDGQQPYVPPDGAELNLRAKKPDGKVVFAPLRKADGKYYLDVGGQLCTVPGVVDAQVEIVKNGFRLNSAKFDIIVHERTVQDGDIVSDDDLTTLHSYVSRSETAASGAETSEVAAKQSEENAAKSAEFADTTVKQVLTSVEDAARSADSARLDADRANAAKTGAEKSAGDALKAKQGAETARDSAQSSAMSADKSEQNAKLSEDTAKASQDAAKVSEDNSKASETNADTDAQAAQQALSDLLRMLGSDIATLVDGKIPADQIPSIATTEIYVAKSDEEEAGLIAQNGDILIRTDQKKSYIWKDTGWVYLAAPTDFAAKAGYAETAGTAENANMINNHRLVNMKRADFETAVKDPQTYYLVYDPAAEV